MGKVLFLLVATLMTVLLTSCGNGIDGKYVCEKNPQIAIEIKDGKVPLMGQSIKYEIKNKKMYVNLWGKSVTYAEIIDSNTLKIGRKICKRD